MDIHPLARSCPRSRALAVSRVREERWTVAEAAEAAGFSTRTLHKWLRRFDEEGAQGLLDRHSRPRRMPRRTKPYWEKRILALRARKLTGPAIARRLGLPASTVARVLKRHRQHRLSLLEPKEPVQRYEHEHPGALLHLDIKKLARIERPGHRVHGDRRTRVHGAGWEYVHVCIDDASRLAYAEVLVDEKGGTAAHFLHRALAWFARQKVRVQRVLTDNGACYRSKVFAAVCRRNDIRHIFTQPYRPQTNGKAERFIGTLVREWAYVKTYAHSRIRAAALRPWLRHYNRERPHGSLDGKAPISRIR